MGEIKKEFDNDFFALKENLKDALVYIDGLDSDVNEQRKRIENVLELVEDMDTSVIGELENENEILENKNSDLEEDLKSEAEISELRSDTLGEQVLGLESKNRDLENEIEELRRR